MSSIVDIVGRKILHWRANPAIEVDVVQLPDKQRMGSAYGHTRTQMSVG